MKKLVSLCIALTAFTFFIFFTSTPISHEEADFFNTSFLRNIPAVQQTLFNEGFIEVDYQTPDNIHINAFMLDQSNTKEVIGTIIFASGFFPGNKEGIASFYHMLKDLPYNLLFFDARGHGKSQGQHMTYEGIKNYTRHEYLDIIGSIEFINRYNASKNINNNIILYGLCSGAFHSIKAIHELEYAQEDTSYIKGIIFDSGWPSFVEVVESSIRSEIKKRFNHWLTYLAGQITQATILLAYQLLFKSHHQKGPSIEECIQDIKQPILFIHSQDDQYIPIHLTQKLIENAQQPTTWIIDQSTHACHHLKHKEAYQENLIRFTHECFTKQTDQ